MVNPKKPNGMTKAQYISLIRENKFSRRGQVYGLWQQGLTYEKIGQMLDPPVSRERVRQMLFQHEWFLKRWNNLKEGKTPYLNEAEFNLMEREYR